MLAVAAVTLGGIQLAIDRQYAGGFGRAPIETTLQAAQGVAIGPAAIMLPSVAAILKRTGLTWGRSNIWRPCGRQRISIRPG